MYTYLASDSSNQIMNIETTSRKRPADSGSANEFVQPEAKRMQYGEQIEGKIAHSLISR